MKTWNDTALRTALLACSLLSAAGFSDAHADEKKPYPKPGYSASPSAVASAPPPPEAEAKLVNGHKPWAPTLDVVLPEVASEAPTKDEWASAPPALDVRVTAPGCSAKRLREWYRVTCSFALIEMIAGERGGVTFGCLKSSPDSELCDKEASIIFPARRGDSRAVEFLTWSKWGPEPDTILTEQFLEGDPYPLISVQGLRWDF
jgi:hypothetical protein